MEYMTKSERELWQNFFESLAQKKNLEEFLQNLEEFLQILKKPDESLKDALKSYDEIISGVKKKFFSLISASALLKKSVAEIENKLESPDCKKKYSPRHSSNFTSQRPRKKNVKTCKR